MSYIPQLDSLVSTSNSTVTSLMMGDVFTGAAEDCSDFATVTLIIKSDVASAPNGISMEFSPDGINWDIQRQHTLEANTGHESALLITGKFFRVVFTNGVADQNSFRLQTIFHKSKTANMTTPLTGEIDADSNAILTRSILSGTTGGGQFKNVGVTPDNAINVSIVDPISAFGEVSMVESTPTIQVDFVYNINPDIVDTITTGSGTVAQASSMATVSTNAAINSSALLSTKRHLKYRSGQGGIGRCSALFTQGVAGSEQRVGLGVSTDGYFFGYNGPTFGIAHTNNSVDTWIAQSNWNIDVMDGSGSAANPSGMLLDPTKGNVYQIVFQGHGFGGIVFSIENPETMLSTPVHRIEFSNNNNLPNTFNPSFPFWFSAENTTNNTDIVVKASSCFAAVQGKVVILGPRNSVSNFKTGVGTTLTNILTVRNKSTFGGIVNQIPVIMSFLSGAVDGSKPAIIEMILNATIAGTPSYTDINAATSCVDYDVAGTTVTGGRTKGTFILAKSEGFFENINDLSIELRPGETLTFAARATTATTDVTVSPSWVEDQ